jgi:hypothetical protein
MNMNRNEAKTYVLDVLGLDRDQVRQFGNLSRTQTWLDAISAHESESEPAETDDIRLEALAEAPAELMRPGEAAPEDSFITFWDAEPEPVFPQPLAGLPALDEAWDDPEPDSPATPPVLVYPIVIALMMLWAWVQLLLLGGKAICWFLSGIATGLDAMAQERLQRQREFALEPSQGLAFAVS